MPRCQEHIQADAEALKCWRYYLPILRRMKVLTEADGLILANLCLAHSFLLANLTKVRELNAATKSGIGGMVVPNKAGTYFSLNQIYANVRDAMEQELKFARELGLSPSARTRIHAEKQEAGSGSVGVLDGQWRPPRGDSECA